MCLLVSLYTLVSANVLFSVIICAFSDTKCVLVSLYSHVSANMTLLVLLYVLLLLLYMLLVFPYIYMFVVLNMCLLALLVFSCPVPFQYTTISSASLSNLSSPDISFRSVAQTVVRIFT